MDAGVQIPNSTTSAAIDDDVSTTVNNECMVCSDKSTGLHYSASTCEGCKGFFKRTVQKQLKYACRGEGQLGGCYVTKESRNNCQHCRYKKCLRVGMNVNAVREDRTPGGRPHAKRQKSEPSSKVVDQELQAHCQATCLVTDEQLVDSTASSSSVSDDGRQDTCKSFNDEKNEDMTQLLEDLKATRPDILPEGDMRAADSGSGSTPNAEANRFIQCGYKELQLIIRWAKKVPGFAQLCISDQMCLLKSSFLELNILRLSYRSMGTWANKLIYFADTLKLTEEETVQLGWDRELVQSTFTFARRLTEIAVDYSDFCLLNALVLSFPDATGLENKEAVERLQTRYMDCFYMYCQTKRPRDTKHYGQMLLRLQVLRALSAKAATCFFQLIDNGTLQKDDLAQEMFVDSFTSL